MEQQSLTIALKILGSVLIVVGLILSVAPSMVNDSVPAVDTFSAIERRIPWGALLGFGFLLIAHTSLKPWGLTIASIALWVTLGILIARVIGLFLDGMDSNRQWLWVFVEVLVIIAAGIFVVKYKQTI